jgi:hypothetical protein
MSDIIAQILIMLALIIIPTTEIITCVKMSYNNERLKEIIRIEQQSNYVKQWQQRNPLLQKKDTVYLKVVKE